MATVLGVEGAPIVEEKTSHSRIHIRFPGTNSYLVEVVEHTPVSLYRA
jgi:hypothetical protein